MVAASARVVPVDDAWTAVRGRREPSVAWIHPVRGGRAAVLLGAFDPPTRAHVALVAGVSRLRGMPGALCLTAVLLDRPSDRLLDDRSKLMVLDEVCAGEGFGFAIANRGTYLDVARAMRGDGIEPTFIIGSDKLAQLADPSFYPDRESGVAATFAEVDLVVIPRAGAPVTTEDVEVLEPSDVFTDPAHMEIAATDVRKRVRAGLPVDDLVPPAVAGALGGYTSAEPT